MGIVTIDGLPVYQALVDSEDTGMLRISLVDDPAVQSDFLAFSKQERAAAVPVKMYAVQDEEKRLVLGVVMRADFPIYRRSKDKDGNEVEYYLLFKADSIRNMAEKYLVENRQNIVNLDHQEGTEQEGIHMVQYFIKGNGLNPEGFDAIADGSLFAEFHITNDEVWDAIKDGTYKGFSLEGIFDLTPETDRASVEEIVDALDGIFSRILRNNQTYQKMKKKGILARLAAMLVEMGNVSTDKGVLAWDGDEDLKAGDAVFIEDENGNRTAAADGDYTTEDGKVIVVVEGKVAEIKDSAAEVAPAATEGADETKTINTDKGTLSYTGELAVGSEVSVTNEDGTTSAAPDGDYVAEDGSTIVVAEGKVTEIKPKEEEGTDPAVEAKMQRLQRIAQAFQETYNDKMNAFVKAIEGLGFNYPWIVEAGDEFCIAEVWSEGTGDYLYYRFNVVEWKEDGSVVLENGVKVVPAFVTPEEKETAEENFRNLQSEKETLSQQVADLTAQVETLKKTPAAKSAHETFEASAGAPGKTGNKGLDNLARVMGAK